MVVVSPSIWKKFEDEIEVSIADEGLGVPDEDLANVFDRFFRVDKARSREMGGTGLGLAIAREVIEAHGGRIWAERNKTKGTIIKFTLPYSDLPEDDWEWWKKTGFRSFILTILVVLSIVLSYFIWKGQPDYEAINVKEVEKQPLTRQWQHRKYSNHTSWL